MIAIVILGIRNIYENLSKSKRITKTTYKNILPKNVKVTKLQPFFILGAEPIR